MFATCVHICMLCMWFVFPLFVFWSECVRAHCENGSGEQRLWLPHLTQRVQCFYFTLLFILYGDLISTLVLPRVFLKLRGLHEREIPLAQQHGSFKTFPPVLQIFLPEMQDEMSFSRQKSEKMSVSHEAGHNYPACTWSPPSMDAGPQ